jgi:hypothetical protein
MFVLILTALTVTAWPGDAVGDDEDKQFSRFRVRLMDGTHIEGKNGVLTATQLEGVQQGNRIEISRQEIRAMDACVGNQAAKGMFFGGALGLLLAGYVILDLESDPYSDLVEYDKSLVVLGCAGGGAVLGLGIGAAFLKWDSIDVMSSQHRISIDVKNRVVVVAFTF